MFSYKLDAVGTLYSLGFPSVFLGILTRSFASSTRGWAFLRDPACFISSECLGLISVTPREG